MRNLKYALALAGVLFSSCAAQAQSVPAVTTNRSVTIATGNTYQSVLAAGSWRSITIQNNNASDNCWLQFGIGVTTGTASKGASILLLPGQAFTRYFPYLPKDQIFGTCASNSDTIYVDTQ